MDVIFVHGYNVTSTRTYGVLPARLKAAGHTIKNVYLSKYVTLDNDLTLPDVIKAFQAALAQLYGRKFGKRKFACITHSTGGLVVRGWISSYYSRQKGELPLTHLIMLAPPNFGSRLAELGRSRLSRLRSLWGVEPGLRILESLELGSRYQWELNSLWLKERWHKTPGFFPVVIAGEWIDRSLWDVLAPATYERGSDGVVRAASANINMKKWTVRAEAPVREEKIEGVPFLIPSKMSHSDERFGIIGSVPGRGNHPVLAAIQEVLAVRDARSYRALAQAFDERTHRLQENDRFYDGTRLDRYCQVVFRITDNTGTALSDYAIELIDEDQRGDRLPEGFFGDRHKNGANPEFLVYYLNFDKLSRMKGALGFRVQCTVQSPRVCYEEVLCNAFPSISDFIRPNQTTYVDVTLPRRINRAVFQLTSNLSYQKIKGKPVEDWA